MKQLSEYFMESIFSYVFDLKKENIAAEISNAIANSNVNASVDGDKKVIKSKSILICTKDNNPAIYLCDTKGINNPHIYVIPNKEWKIVTQDIIIAPETIDASLINLEGSKLKQVSLQRNSLDAIDCLKGYPIETFRVHMGSVKQGFEKAISSLNIKRLEYMYSIAYPGTFFDPKATLNCDELAIRGCKYMSGLSYNGSKKGDQVTRDNCPCTPGLTLLLSNNPQLKVIIDWQFDGVYAQARLEDGKIVFDQLRTDNINTAFKKCK